MPEPKWRLSTLKAAMDGSFSNENPVVFVQMPDGTIHHINDVECVQGKITGQGTIIIKID